MHFSPCAIFIIMLNKNSVKAACVAAERKNISINPTYIEDKFVGFDVIIHHGQRNIIYPYAYYGTGYIHPYGCMIEMDNTLKELKSSLEWCSMTCLLYDYLLQFLVRNHISFRAHYDNEGNFVNVCVITNGEDEIEYYEFCLYYENDKDFERFDLDDSEDCLCFEMYGRNSKKFFKAIRDILTPKIKEGYFETV